MNAELPSSATVISGKHIKINGVTLSKGGTSLAILGMLAVLIIAGEIAKWVDGD